VSAYDPLLTHSSRWTAARGVMSAYSGRCMGCSAVSGDLASLEKAVGVGALVTRSKYGTWCILYMAASHYRETALSDLDLNRSLSQLSPGHEAKPTKTRETAKGKKASNGSTKKSN
jgi:hypothetical protein